MTDKSSPNRANIAALIAVVILAALLLWVAQSIMAHNKLQNCLDSGRRDCLPVDAGARAP
ncbi:hypothetical protein [Lichenifustis flavocetrariae]|uniref:Uncharacterized protein n=1 Tax=Lichenifustis flavocetrariae TaxID=2949735 RepID=A0AA41Z1R5_9HYPH|nr:hypothetical protein [Lichenifustis flavocetrariae]MCW6508903.1 hypothetical protein [Lichenifustis flavocetrariae]